MVRVRDLVVDLGPPTGSVRAVDGVTLEIGPGEIVALAGESGAGKSTLGRAILGLLPEGARASGTVEVGGIELLGGSEKVRSSIRGSVVGWIPQSPRGALHPTLPIGRQLAEVLRTHRRSVAKADVARLRDEWLDRVGLAGWGAACAHELSGGMRQRALVALALAGEPRIVVADEPTTALDRPLAGAIRSLLLDLVRDLGVALLWIGHDLEHIRALEGRLEVMYAGQIVESGPVAQVWASPAHPYTEALRACETPPEPGGRWSTIPSARTPPVRGCVFWPRCSRRADPRCETERPELRPVGEDGHRAATWCGRD